MARPKAFNVGDALDRAMRVFSAQGFAATSLDDLTAAMEISRSSLYATFGSKHDLFLATLTHHNETVLPRQFTPLMSPVIGLKPGVTQVFASIMDDSLTGKEYTGWYLAKAACEVAPDDEQATRIIAAGFESVEEIFRDAITAAQQTGEIAPWRDPVTLARHFTAAIQGLAVMARTQPQQGALEDIATVALIALD